MYIILTVKNFKVNNVFLKQNFQNLNMVFKDFFFIFSLFFLYYKSFDYGNQQLQLIRINIRL